MERAAGVRTQDDQDEDDLEALEPQVTSSDPNVRKLARTLRIKRRIEAIRRQHEPMNEEEQESKKTALEVQVQKSAEQLEKLLIDGEELITNVAVGNDCREVSRRESEQAVRQELLQRLEEEAALAVEMYDELSCRWSDLQLAKDPLEVRAGIEEQRCRCSQLLAQKDEVLCELRGQLSRLEQQLWSEQAAQREELRVLATRVDRQVQLMRGAYRGELRLVEAAVEEERGRLVSAGLQRWQQLHQQRDQLEHDNMLKKNAQQDGYLEELHDNRVRNEELHRRTRIALENDSQVLQQELEHLKAFCMLNSEKLDYNYQILKKREDENLIIKSQQKRLMNRLRDELNRCRASGERYRRDSTGKARRLHQEIRKLRDSVFNVEAKAELLTAANDAKYMRVWRHNEQLAGERLRHILAADRVLSEQLLGADWSAPRFLRVDMCALPSHRAAAGSPRPPLHQPPPPPPPPPLPDGVRRAVLAKIGERSGYVLEQRLAQIADKLASEQGQLVRVESVFEALGVHSEEHMQALLDCFLPYMWCAVCSPEDGGVGPSAMDVRAAPAASTASTTTVHQIPDMLGDVQQPLGLVDRLVAAETRSVSTYEDEEEVLLLEAGSSSGGESSGAAVDSGTSSSAMSLEAPTSARARLLNVRRHLQDGHPLAMEAAYVHKALKQLAVRLAADRGVGVGSGGGSGLEERLVRRRVTVSRALSREDVGQFWAQYTSAFPAARLQLWSGLQLGLARYHAVLQDRHKLHGQLSQLRRQNGELRQLLDTCAAPGDSCPALRR